MRLEHVSYLDFYKNYYTSGGTTKLPQIVNVGRSTHIVPTSIRCSNNGFDGHDVSWLCKAYGLPYGVTLRDATVSCESYPGSYDEVYTGSCQVEYRLEERFPTPHHGGPGILETVIVLFLVAFAFMMIWGFYEEQRDMLPDPPPPRRRRRRRRTLSPVRRRGAYPPTPVVRAQTKRRAGGEKKTVAKTKRRTGGEKGTVAKTKRR